MCTRSRAQKSLQQNKSSPSERRVYVYRVLCINARENSIRSIPPRRCTCSIVRREESTRMRRVPKDELPESLVCARAGDNLERETATLTQHISHIYLLLFFPSSSSSVSFVLFVREIDRGKETKEENSLFTKARVFIFSFFFFFFS